MVASSKRSVCTTHSRTRRSSASTRIAQPSDQVRNLLVLTGDIAKFNGKKDAVSRVKVAESDKAGAAAEAVKAAEAEAEKSKAAQAAAKAEAEAEAKAAAEASEAEAKAAEAEAEEAPAEAGEEA